MSKKAANILTGLRDEVYLTVCYLQLLNW